jgi:hypothetical protein
MNYQCIQQLNPRAFKRRFGVRKKTFKKIVKIIKSFQASNKHSNSGAKPLQRQKMQSKTFKAEAMTPHSL